MYTIGSMLCATQVNEQTYSTDGLKFYPYCLPSVRQILKVMPISYSYCITMYTTLC